MNVLTKAIDRLSGFLASTTMVTVIILIGVMAYEVVMRRFLNAPTIWAFDVSYMLNGYIFIGAAGYVYLTDGHIRVTFLSERMPERLRQLIELVFLIVLFIPTIGWVSYTSIDRSHSSFVTDEIERVSVWAPYIWPFYSALAIGLIGLFLQSVSEVLKRLVLLTEDRAKPPHATHSGNNN